MFRKLLQLSLFGILYVYSAVASADVKVAFIADQGIDETARSVLSLVANEGADILLIQGDLGYDFDASAQWENNLREILGENFPVLSVVGNHENFEWPAYQRYIIDRINRIPELNCEGNFGIKAFCTFRGLAVVQVAPGIREVEGVQPVDGYDSYIQQKLTDSGAAWKICSWHKNQTAMQVGGKNNSTGWGVYQACLNQGAIVATGHSHTYSRTYLMSSFENQTIAHQNSHLELDRGRSFAFVSGLGGSSIRDQSITADWWASVYTRTQDASAGALFCNFEDVRANCYFMDIKGAIPDSFSLDSRLVPSEPEVVEPEVVEPEVAEPEVAEPEVAEPEVAEPEVAEPPVVVTENTQQQTPEQDAANQPLTTSQDIAAEINRINGGAIGLLTILMGLILVIVRFNVLNKPIAHRYRLFKQSTN